MSGGGIDIPGWGRIRISHNNAFAVRGRLDPDAGFGSWFAHDTLEGMGFNPHSRRLFSGHEATLARIAVEPSPAYRAPGSTARRSLGTLNVRINDQMVLEQPLILLMDVAAAQLALAREAGIVPLLRVLRENDAVLSEGPQRLRDAAKHVEGAVADWWLATGDEILPGRMNPVLPLHYQDDLSIWTTGCPEPVWASLFGILKRPAL